MSKHKKPIFSFLLILALIFSCSSLPGMSTLVRAQDKNEQAGDMAVHFLDVGQGLSVLIQSGGENLLYDGGDRSASSFVVSYLQKQQITNIDYLISSHYDADHVSGLIGCLNTFSVSNVIGADYVHDSDLYTSFMDSVAAQGLEVQHPEAGTAFDFGTGQFTVLSPSETDANDSNANSVAIKLMNGDNSFIITGDAENQSEADMISSGIDLECDVLCVGHHGSASSTSWDFLQAAVPEYAVISCGKDNQYGHPDADTMDKLYSMEIEVFRTDKQGTVVAVSDGTDITWNVSPCNDYSPGSDSDTGTEAAGSSSDLFSTGAVEESPSAEETQTQGAAAWLSATGSKYHSIPDCGRMDPNKATQTTEAEAQAQGYEACSKCW